ncbi:DNA-binding SARP family transcriptional activator [Allocatelliglobosispora scoriae]|uniref:DNA-binding SARP family transcriptional activator n=1 Tax=Allocatelliglobosispora scoriae TaxID=643052 RepID=A0A841BR93_9ACTN|nr:BTAD domain-containing putative transcriptional regulator [Allocatelliglobosispora scoriae]MBB5869272.1 DNA-binding SARP family transcriptional activator [Allocatelliglobosispora scoriae]
MTSQVTEPIHRDALRFEILGPVRAQQGEREIDLGPGKQRAVLAALLVNANRPVPTAQIVDAVWGEEPPENGANVVQKYIAGLRRVLEPDRSPRTPGGLLALTDGGYVLTVAPGCLDAENLDERFHEALHLRDEGRTAEAARRLRDALKLWRAEPLAGCTGTYFDAARDHLTERRAAALEACVTVELQLGEHVKLVPELVALIAEFPLREELRYLLILSLYRCGRQAESLSAYREMRRFLDEEFGVEPSERLQELHRRILQSDPALLGRSAPVVHPPPPPHQPVPPVVYVPWQPYLPMRPTPPPAHDPSLTWLVGLASAIVPILSCGFAGWGVVAIFAALRRSKWLAAATLGHLAVTVFAWIAMLTSPEDLAGPWDDLGVVALIVAIVGGSVHGGILGFTWRNLPGRAPFGTAPARPAPPHVLVQQDRREQARQLLASHPAIARQLHIGRPDLPRAFDDGGLVDVNNAPAQVLATLPGVTAEAAQRIVVDRQLRGELRSVDELISRQLLPPYVVHMLRDELIAL